MANTRRALQYAIRLPIDLIIDSSLHAEAAEIAIEFDLAAAYDAHYLALSERLAAEFWTCDKRLYNSVHHSLPWVHYIEP